MVVRIRRLRCDNTGCGRRTFREQVPGLIERSRRRTVRLALQLGVVVRELAGRASVRVLGPLAMGISRYTAIRAFMELPLPPQKVPAVLGVDDFALKRRLRYATVLIDAVTGARVDVLPDRKAETLQTWLETHPSVEVVCRDGSAAYAQAIANALPKAVQVNDRWQIWRNFGEAVLKEVRAHAACWSKGDPASTATKRAQTTLERLHAIHDLVDNGVGLLDCARRLQLSLNTVKRYARVTEPERLSPVPQHRTTLGDPYRDYLRGRRETEPGVSIGQLLEEIKALGYPGSSNLLHRYINQGRVEADRRPHSPRALTSLILTDPEHLKPQQRELVDELTGKCGEITALAGHARSFASLLRPDVANVERLEAWITRVRADDLPGLHAFTLGIDQDRGAVTAVMTLPFHNGRTEGVNTKTKHTMRQMFGRDGIELLCHRILLGSSY